MEKTRYQDVRGTTSRGCPDYNKGLCGSNDCHNPGHEVCIGTRLCDNFWKWFLKEKAVYFSQAQGKEIR